MSTTHSGIRKINVGCGYDKREGYLNVDVDPACNPDLLVKDHDLSGLGDHRFQEVRAWDVLEHIPHQFTMSALLDWAALLVEEGVLVLQTSSMEGVIDVMRLRPSFETEFNWTRCMFGNQQHPGDFHHTGFTKTTLTVQLRAAGFDPSDLRLNDGWLLECRALKVYDWLKYASMDIDSMIHYAFQTYLRRKADEDDILRYCEYMKNGISKRQILKSLIASPEHLYKLGACEESKTLI